jgi:hypothetical protein
MLTEGWKAVGKHWNAHQSFRVFWIGNKLNYFCFKQKGTEKRTVSGITCWVQRDRILGIGTEHVLRERRESLTRNGLRAPRSNMPIRNSSINAHWGVYCQLVTACQGLNKTSFKDDLEGRYRGYEWTTLMATCDQWIVQLNLDVFRDFEVVLIRRFEPFG